MTDQIARTLAVVALLIALCVGYFTESCNCTDGRKPNRVGWLARWVTWMAVKDEFEMQPVQDPGALRQENTPPERKKGSTGEVELEHGRNW